MEFRVTSLGGAQLSTPPLLLGPVSRHPARNHRWCRLKLKQISQMIVLFWSAWWRDIFSSIPRNTLFTLLTTIHQQPRLSRIFIDLSMMRHSRLLYYKWHILLANAIRILHALHNPMASMHILTTTFAELKTSVCRHPHVTVVAAGTSLAAFVFNGDLQNGQRSFKGIDTIAPFDGGVHSL